MLLLFYVRITVGNNNLKFSLNYNVTMSQHMEAIIGQFRGDGRTVRTLVFGVYKI